MTMLAALTPSAAEAVSGETAYFGTAVMAGMRPVEGGSEPEANRDPNGVVVHSEAIDRGSMLRPRKEVGRALSQASDSLAEAAKRRALAVASGAPSNRASAVADTL